MISADLAPPKRRGAHCSRLEQRGVREQQGFSSDLDRLHDRVLGRMRDVAYDTEPVTCLDRLGAKGSEPFVGHCAGLEVANVVRRIVHELSVPHTALLRLLEAFELHLEEVEPFDVHHDGRLPRFVRRLQIGGGKRTAQTVGGDHLIHPSEAFEMVPIELARLWCARRG